MTPVDEALKKNYRAFLAEAGIEAVYPPHTLGSHTDAVKLTPSEVESMTKNAFEEHRDVEAVYFQGALLDPLKVLQKLETDLSIPIVASNPAMLWSILSQLGLSYQISGYGRLLASWPPLPLS